MNMWVVFCLFCTHMIAIHQNCEACSEADANNDSPIRLIVGVIAKGPIKRKIKPIRPLNPITTWNKADTVIAP